MDALTLILFIIGLVLLIVGAEALIKGASRLAAGVGVSPLVIGLTIVAIGTSSPELALSVSSSLAGQPDIAMGNVVGSNIFNIMGVLGTTALVARDGVSVAPSLLSLDLPLMLATAVACLPIFFTGHEIARWEGGVFLAYYGAYTSYLILNATQHAALPAFSSVMLLFVLPITALTFVLSVVRALKARE